MNAPNDLKIKLTSFAHGGGCGCKIAPGVLSEILQGVRGIVPPQLLVGIETADDAAVYQLNDEQAIVATTDFFTPVVDDPYDFGRIAATNAISDVYAMGGTPIMALALLGMPIDKIPLEVIRRIAEGGQSVCNADRDSDRGRAHDRFGRADLWPGRVGPGSSGEGQEKQRCAGGRRADSGKTSRSRRLLGCVEKRRSRRRRLRADDRQHDQAQHSGPQVCRHARRARDDRRHRLWFARALERNRARQQPRGQG